MKRSKMPQDDLGRIFAALACPGVWQCHAITRSGQIFLTGLSRETEILTQSEVTRG